MNYTSAVSIIPGGCPQFLDCRLDAKSLGRFWAYFREIPQTGESAIASARRQVELVPVPLDDTAAWANTIAAASFRRDPQAREKAIKAGYDIHTSAEVLQAFYLRRYAEVTP